MAVHLIVEEDGSPLHRIEPGQGFAELFLAASGNTGHAEDFPAEGVERDLIQFLHAVRIDTG